MPICSKEYPADTFLGLFDEPFYVFDRKDSTLTVYNKGYSRLTEGRQSLNEFILHLRNSLTEVDYPSLDSFRNHLKNGTESFTVMFSENFLNDLGDVIGISVRGQKKVLENGDDITVGVFHQRKTRNTTLGDGITFDQLTELVSKMDITNIAIDHIDRDHNEGTYIAIVDVDHFKFINDNYGHQYGDYVLTKIAEILRSVVGYQGFVGRIGGDEFFIVFTARLDIAALRDNLQNIRLLVNKTFEGKGPREGSPLSVSIGAAKYPDDAGNYNDLFTVADYCLFLAKEKGRNRYVFYTPEKHPPLAEIKRIRHGGQGIVNGRDDMPLGDVLVQMQYMLLYEKNVDTRQMLLEYKNRFKLPFIALMNMGESRIEFENRGKKDSGISAGDITEVVEIAYEYTKRSEPNGTGIWVCNQVDHLTTEYEDITKRMFEKNLISFIGIPFTDIKGNDMLLFFGSFGTNSVWNEQHFIYHRLFVDALSSRSF